MTPVVCAACRDPLESRHDTNGSGELVLLVRGCLRCARLLHLVKHRIRPVKRQARKRTPRGPCAGQGKDGHTIPKPKRNEAGRLVCIVCGADIQHLQKRGRPPCYCAEHRTY